MEGGISALAVFIGFQERVGVTGPPRAFTGVPVIQEMAMATQATAYEFSASCPELALCLGAEMAFEYRVVNTVEEASQLSEDGFELFTILPPGPAGGPDRMYLRREKRRGQTPGFARESRSESG